MKLDEITVKNLKILIARGYTDKQIALVSKYSRAFINKVRNGSKHSLVKLERADKLQIDKKEIKRLDALQKILDMPEMWGVNISNNDIYYIHLLKFLGKSKNEVFNLYFHLSQKAFGSIWNKSGVDIKMFDAEKIGVDNSAYLDLIIDFFIE